MLDTTYQLAQKAIFEINHLQDTPAASLLEILQGTIYEYICREYGFEPDWLRFCGYGQMETEDQRLRMQTAIVRSESDETALDWALRLKARDQTARRRNWLLHIGIHLASAKMNDLFAGD